MSPPAPRSRWWPATPPAPWPPGVRGALGIGGWLSALYGVLFVLLQLEDVALLVGSVFVFVMLALVMFLTRRIDWSGARVPEPV